MLSRQSNYTTLGAVELGGALTLIERRRRQAEDENDGYMSSYWQGAHDALWAVGAHRLDYPDDLLTVMDAIIKEERKKGAETCQS